MQQNRNGQTTDGNNKLTGNQTQSSNEQVLRKELSDLQRKFDEWKQKAKIGVNQLRQRAVQLTQALRVSQRERQQLQKRLDQYQHIRSLKVEQNRGNSLQSNNSQNYEHRTQLQWQQLLSFFSNCADHYQQTSMTKVDVVFELLQRQCRVMQTRFVEQFEVYKRRTSATLRLQSKNSEKLTQLVQQLQKKLVTAEDALRVNQVALRNRDDAINKLQQQLQTCQVARKEMQLEHMQLVQSPNMNELNVMHDELQRRVWSVREEYMTLQASLRIAHRNEIQRLNAQHERQMCELQRQLERTAAQATRHNVSHYDEVMHSSKQSPDNNGGKTKQSFKRKQKQSEDDSLHKYNTSNVDIRNNTSYSSQSQKQQSNQIGQFRLKSCQQQQQMFIRLLDKYKALLRKCQVLPHRSNDQVQIKPQQISGQDAVVQIINSQNDNTDNVTGNNNKQNFFTSCRNTSKQALNKKLQMPHAASIIVSLDVENATSASNSAHSANYNDAAVRQDFDSSDQIRSKSINLQSKRSDLPQTASLNQAPLNILTSENVSMSDLTKLQSSIKLLKQELWNAKKQNVKLKQSVHSASLPQGALDAQQVQYLRSVLIKILCNLTHADVVKHLLPVVKTVLRLPDDEMACVYKCNPSWRVRQDV